VEPDEEVGVPPPLPPLETCCDADPLPLQLSTAMTWKFNVPRFKPALAHASKWFWIVTVPLLRGDWRIEMYWLKVAVPIMEGSLTRWFSQIA
jgi:hypothetical protein